MGNLAAVLTPEGIERVEASALSLPQSECPVTHTFGPGVYIREVVLPAGSIVIGHHHNFHHTNIMICGRLTAINSDGSATEWVAPMMYVGGPGRKVVYVHEDTVWLNVFATDETDVEALEAKLLTKSASFESNAAVEKAVGLLALQSEREDFFKAISDFGLTPEAVWEISSNESDLTPFPFGSYKVAVSDSNIHGRGLFATSDIAANELIAPARIDGKRTPAGRFTNHSCRPNARMMPCENGDIVLVAISGISGSRGGAVGQEITVDYRDVLGGGKCPQ